jgi:hypothetical protein
MFSQIIECVKGALQHLGMNLNNLIKCKCQCCNKTTYCYTCKEIREIYRKLSTRGFEQSSSKLFTIIEN